MYAQPIELVSNQNVPIKKKSSSEYLLKRAVCFEKIRARRGFKTRTIKHEKRENQFQGINSPILRSNFQKFKHSRAV